MTIQTALPLAERVIHSGLVVACQRREVMGKRGDWVLDIRFVGAEEAICIASPEQWETVARDHTNRKGTVERMSQEHIYTLVASSNHGRLAGDDPAFGPDLTSGRAVAVLLGERWIAGTVEGSRHPTSLETQGCYVIEEEVGLFTCYYFIAESGEVCGLCTGMKVKLL